jgi:spore coat protein JB
MTYTPMQRKGSPKFTAGEGLDRGTLFPGLELPFMNNYSVKNVANSPLGELQALDFALVELALYLNTHKTDMEAFQLFKQYANAYHDKKMAYVKMYGPIEKMHAAEADRWNWIDDPWPWDYSDRR